ncbi:uncharacterized protein LOC126739652 [Anthonomus grandis grandis]|uniref:uncharacterized protein LOC126739652 n=1 Tax=Anthonomus grandis grandis TaxID=2921223 RepID=UPI0021651434|nr:uncharacterized protein LOC126739652 [Anthonomus grandis grandis]XP_050301383.1 uncharacterized protein LOC126739652 [Anthonomus grandis grandis]
MKFFIVISTLLVAANAGVITPVAVPAAVARAVVSPAILTTIPVGVQSSQYHSQDAAGQYSYGYANELSAKNEIKSADGQTIGSYSYMDAEGKIQNVQYRSDAAHGFRVSATNLPVGPAPIEAAPMPLPEPVKDTPEVIEARSRHLEALKIAEEQAKKLSDSVAVEVKSTIEHRPALITAATPAVEVRATPLIAAPAFSYSFGIDHAKFLAVNTYSLTHQPLVAAYAAPGHIIAAPILAQPILNEPSKDLPEVVEARSLKIADPEMAEKEKMAQMEKMAEKEKMAEPEKKE